MTDVLPPTAELEAAARPLLDAQAYRYYAAGAGDERSLAEVEAAWSWWWLRPRVLRDVSTVSTATSVLGTPVSLPVLTAPTALNGLAHADAEAAVARAVRAAGTVQVLSTASTLPIEEVAAVGGHLWYQLYTRPEWAETAARVRRAEAAGASALVVTVDLPELGLRPRGLGDHDARNPALVPLLGSRLGQNNPGFDWAALERLRQLTPLPVVLKGILAAADARRAAAAGVEAIIVSNHGARQLDGELPSALALRDCVAAAGDDLEVYVDSGLRSGADVLRALALGARAVLVGRPYLWALALGGAEGVAALLARLGEELRNAMALCGQTDARSVEADIVVPGHAVAGRLPTLASP